MFSDDYMCYYIILITDSFGNTIYHITRTLSNIQLYSKKQTIARFLPLSNMRHTNVYMSLNLLCVDIPFTSNYVLLYPVS